MVVVTCGWVQRESIQVPTVMEGGRGDLLQRSRASTLHCKFQRAGPYGQGGRGGERRYQLLHDLLVVCVCVYI